jgi:hypothetical protein
VEVEYSEVVVRAILFLVVLKCVIAILPSIKTRKPPLGVRLVGNLEFAFGACMALPSIAVLVVRPAETLGWRLILILAVFAAAGVFWCTLAVQLFKGRAWAKHTCVILSLVRAFTLVGTAFSVVSLYVLTQNRAAKSFFEEAGKSEREDQGKPR